MSGLLCTVAFIIVLFLSQGDAATNVREVQRNGINVTVRCETDVLPADFIWYIGNKRSVADTINFNGRLSTAMKTIPVTETIQVTCIAKNRSTSENDTLPLHPLEVSTDPTIVTSLTTDTDGGGTITDSVTEATSTTHTEDTCGTRCITDTNNVTEATSTIPSENTCGVGCIVGIAVSAVFAVLVLLLVLLVIFLVCWKKESLATFCSKAMSKVGIHKSPRNDTPHQPGQQTGIPTPPTSPPVTETNSSLTNSAVMIPMSQTLSGPERNHDMDMPVPPETIDNGAVELVVPTSRRQQPPSAVHRQSSVESLPTNTEAIRIPDRRVFTAEYGSPSQPAHTVINMEQEEPQ